MAKEGFSISCFIKSLRLLFLLGFALDMFGQAPPFSNAKLVPDAVTSLTVGADGSMYATGYRGYGLAPYIARIDPGLTVVWAQDLPRTSASAFGNATGRKVVIDARREIYVVGGADVAGTPSSPFLVRYSSNGELRWIRTADQTYAAYFHSAASDPQGGVYVTGFSYGDVAFGTTSIKGANNFGFLAKFDAAGNCNWIRRLGGQSANSSVSIYTAGLDLALDPEGNVLVCGMYYGGVALVQTTCR